MDRFYVDGMNYLLVLLLPAVFFGMTGLVVREVHAMERRRDSLGILHSNHVLRQQA